MTFYIFNFIIQNTLPKEKIKDGSISTIVDSYFRTAIGITPVGPVVFSGSLYFMRIIKQYFDTSLVIHLFLSFSIVD